MIDEAEQAVLALIKQWAGERKSLRQIATELEQRGHVNRHGRRFGAQAIKNLIARSREETT